jgi:hypothetical protein
METDPSVRSDNTDQLVAVMAAIAGGDRSAVVTLYIEFGGRMAAGVRRRLRELGVHHPEEGQVQDLVMDACFELESCAKAWDPEGGALPWNWARRRLDAMIARRIGVFADPLDDALAERVADTTRVADTADRAAIAVLADLASYNERARHLIAEFDAARVSDRDRAVFLEYVLQSDLGDPSPARTVGSEFGLEAATVRQIVSRTRTRLARSSESRSVADAPFLAS